MTDREWMLEKRNLSKSLTSIVGYPIKVVDAKFDELGYTMGEDTIYIARKHELMENLNEEQQMIFREGIGVHEILHILLTDFATSSNIISSYPIYEQRLLAELINIIEDPSIENFAHQYVGGRCLRSLKYSIAHVYRKSPNIDTFDNELSQYMNALIQFGDMGLIKGTFTFHEAKEMFYKTSEIFLNCIDEPDAAKRVEYGRETFELSRPLWEKYIEKEKLLNEILSQLAALGKDNKIPNNSRPKNTPQPNSSQKPNAKNKRRQITVHKISKEELEEMEKNNKINQGPLPDEGDITLLVCEEENNKNEQNDDGSSGSISKSNNASDDGASESGGSSDEYKEDADSSSKGSSKNSDSSDNKSSKDSNGSSDEYKEDADSSSEGSSKNSDSSDDKLSQDSNGSFDDKLKKDDSASEDLLSNDDNLDDKLSKDVSGHFNDEEENNENLSDNTSKKNNNSSDNLLNNNDDNKELFENQNSNMSENNSSPKWSKNENIPETKYSEQPNQIKTNEDYEILNSEYEISDEDLKSIKEELDAALFNETVEDYKDIHNKNTSLDFPLTTNKIPNVKCTNNRVALSNSTKLEPYYNDVVNTMRNGINRIIKQFRDIFRNDNEELCRHVSGTINIHRLNNSTKTTKVFDRRKLPAEKEDMSIFILVDESGSMGGRKALAARMTCIALAEVFEKLNIPIYIMGFSTHENGCGAVHNHYITWRNTKAERFKLLNINGHTCNFDSYSIRYATEILKKKKTNHKLMLILSDGTPSAYDYNAHGVNGVTDAQAAIKEAKKITSVLGVAIGKIDLNAISYMYGSDYIHINNVDELFVHISKKLAKLVQNWQ